ncbi:PRD domain-containing protein, partial [Carnobacterium sp.]|uniref:BglG family transcription antiterminator n=1 Tax=Carnobacterium sp. TaxID=48221 RepID=UPI0028AD9E37
VSRSSIAADMKQIKHYFELNGTPLTVNHTGTYFTGNEYERQEVLQRFVLDISWNQYSDSSVLIQLYNQFFEEQLVEQLFEIVDKFLEQVKVTINDQNIRNIQSGIIILVGRGKQEKRLSRPLDDYSFEQLHDMTTYLLTVDLANEIESKLSFEFSSYDLVYVNKLLIGSGIEPIKSMHGIKQKYSQLIDEAIDKMSASMGVNLTQDHLLREGLATHIIPMIYRIQNNIQIKNPLLTLIKEKYSVMYGLTWFVLMDLERELKINLSEDEVAFIMVHFQAAMERKRKSIKVLFVCPNGYGTSSLLASQIKQVLPNIDSYETLSLNQMATNNLSNFDFIISTIPIDLPNKRVIKVSPILTPRDIKNVLDNYGDWFIEHSDYSKEFVLENKTSALMVEVLQLDDIYVDYSFDSKEEALHFLCSELEKEEQVTVDFRESIFGRESLAPTNISNGVAVPHGNPHFVNKSKVKILINRHKIPWGEEGIDVIIMLAINKSDVEHMEPMLLEIFKMIFDRITVETIFIQSTRKQIYESIFKGVNDNEEK